MAEHSYHRKLWTGSIVSLLVNRSAPRMAASAASLQLCVQVNVTAPWVVGRREKWVLLRFTMSPHGDLEIFLKNINQNIYWNRSCSTMMKKQQEMDSLACYVRTSIEDRWPEVSEGKHVKPGSLSSKTFNDGLSHYWKFSWPEKNSAPSYGREFRSSAKSR